MLDVLLTRTELARVRGVDPRNKSLADFHPVAFLQTGSKKIPLFRNSPLAIAQLAAAGRTPGPKMPLRPEPLQPEAPKAK
jgi:hypothetical protein